MVNARIFGREPDAQGNQLITVSALVSRGAADSIRAASYRIAARSKGIAGRPAVGISIIEVIGNKHRGSDGGKARKTKKNGPADVHEDAFKTEFAALTSHHLGWGRFYGKGEPAVRGPFLNKNLQ